MTDTPAFQSQVIAYPAITVIKREKPGRTRVAHRPLIDRATLTRLARTLTDDAVPSGGDVVEVERITNGSEPWLLQSLDQLELVRRLEADFPCLEETRCTVGIGVATGADRVFIGPFESLDVEENRKLRLVRTKDITDGTVRWLGFGVINPFNEDGSLVDLVNYPRFSRYLEKHGDIIRARNCAKRNPSGWYRTIDRIDPRLAGRPKLLIPDIKGEAHIVLEAGHLYPHHNLYFITSEEWDLKALQAVLRSGIAKLFVSAYSTRMRGGYLRFQAQYLRRIRLPHWRDVPENVRAALIESTDAGDTDAANDATFVLYGLTPRERAAVGGHSDQSVQ